MVNVGKNIIIDDKAQISSGVVNGGTFWPTARRFAESVIHSNAAGWPTIVAANRTASIFQQKHNDEQGSTTPKLENGKNKNRNTKFVLSANPFGWQYAARAAVNARGPELEGAQQRRLQGPSERWGRVPF